MNEGMLWYVNDTNEGLEGMVGKAVAFFRKKYGCAPLICYLHPESLPSEFLSKDDVRVMPHAMVIKNHIWLEFPGK
jgi:hypothetical protein